MNKPVYLGLSILGLSKILMHDFWSFYVNPNYGKKTKLCYIDTDNSIVYIKTDYIYKDIAVVETKSDTSNYELDKPLLNEKKLKVIGLR